MHSRKLHDGKHHPETRDTADRAARLAKELNRLAAETQALAAELAQLQKEVPLQSAPQNMWAEMREYDEALRAHQREAPQASAPRKLNPLPSRTPPRTFGEDWARDASTMRVGARKGPKRSRLRRPRASEETGARRWETRALGEPLSIEERAVLQPEDGSAEPGTETPLAPEIWRFVERGPGLKASDDGDLPTNPDLWSEELEHAMAQGLLLPPREVALFYPDMITFGFFVDPMAMFQRQRSKQLRTFQRRQEFTLRIRAAYDRWQHKVWEPTPS